jgi:hypothetical protein
LKHRDQPAAWAALNRRFTTATGPFTVPKEYAHTGTDFINWLRSPGYKITPKLEEKLIEEFEKSRWSCERYEIHEITDYDS